MATALAVAMLTSMKIPVLWFIATRDYWPPIFAPTAVVAVWRHDVPKDGNTVQGHSTGLLQWSNVGLHSQSRCGAASPGMNLGKS